MTLFSLLGCMLSLAPTQASTPPLYSGSNVASLAAHRDFSFAAAWHPGGNLLATGNQDTTAAVRAIYECVLCGHVALTVLEAFVLVCCA